MNNDKQIVRLLVRAREDFQGMRKSLDNRIGRKADGKDQDLKESAIRVMSAEDMAMFKDIADAAQEQEKQVEKKLLKVLRRFPIYTQWLKGVKGVGTIGAGWIIGEYDIHIASTVSKLWQFTGLNPGMVRGRKRKDEKDGSVTYLQTDQLIRGDKLTPGFVAPFNKRLRVAIVGVLADGFIKAQNSYCMEFYYPYKARLEQSDNQVAEVSKAGSPAKDIAWKDAKKAHRDRAAKRYMMKMFLRDLYVQWRTLEGLEVREPYQVEYLGKRHAG